MAKQVRHTRTSKKGKVFPAGSKKKAPEKPMPRILFKFQDMVGTKKILKAIQDLANEARIKVDKRGIHIMEMDPANVAMIVVDIKPGKDSIITQPSQSAKFALNMNDLYKTMKDHAKGDVVDVWRLQDKIIFERSDLRQQLPIIVMDNKEKKIPNLMPKYTIKAKLADLNMIVVQADKVAGAITFVSKPGKLEWFAEGDMTRSDGHMNGKSSGSLGEKAKFSIEYLKRFVQLYPVFPDVTVRFHKDYPFDAIASGPSGTYRFILAPRVEND